MPPKQMGLSRMRHFTDSRDIQLFNNNSGKILGYGLGKDACGAFFFFFSFMG